MRFPHRVAQRLQFFETKFCASAHRGTPLMNASHETGTGKNSGKNAGFRPKIVMTFVVKKRECCGYLKVKKI